MIITCEHFLLLFTFAATHSSSIKMNLVYQCNRKVDYVVHLESKEENYEYIMVECLSAICCLILLFFSFQDELHKHNSRKRGRSRLPQQKEPNKIVESQLFCTNLKKCVRERSQLVFLILCQFKYYTYVCGRENFSHSMNYVTI